MKRSHFHNAWTPEERAAVRDAKDGEARRSETCVFAAWYCVLTIFGGPGYAAAPLASLPPFLAPTRQHQAEKQPVLSVLLFNPIHPFPQKKKKERK
jgi:hypothetical protein